jgi:hypothetical protein
VAVGVIVVAVLGFGFAGSDGSAVFGYLGTIGVIPVLAILLLGYTLYANVYPVPAAPFNVFPYLVVAWLLIGVALSFARPTAIRRVAEDLVAQTTHAHAAGEHTGVVPGRAAGPG